MPRGGAPGRSSPSSRGALWPRGRCCCAREGAPRAAAAPGSPSGGTAGRAPARWPPSTVWPTSRSPRCGTAPRGGAGRPRHPGGWPPSSVAWLSQSLRSGTLPLLSPPSPLYPEASPGPPPGGGKQRSLQRVLCSPAMKCPHSSRDRHRTRSYSLRPFRSTSVS